MEADYYPDYYRLETEHWFFVARRRIITALLAARCPSGVPRRILDVGCGTGIMLGDLARFGEVTGLDNSPLALEFCRRRGHTRLLQADLADLAGRPERYDLIAAFDIIEHVEDDAGAVRTLAGALDPGGRLFITVPALPWLWSHHDLINRHQRRYRPGELRRLLTAAGLEIEKMSFFNSLLFPGIAAVRLLQKLVARKLVPQHDLRLPPAPLNRLLTGLFAAEAAWLRRFNFPIGVSLLCLAKKK